MALVGGVGPLVERREDIFAVCHVPLDELIERENPALLREAGKLSRNPEFECIGHGSGPSGQLHLLNQLDEVYVFDLKIYVGIVGSELVEDVAHHLGHFDRAPIPMADGAFGRRDRNGADQEAGDRNGGPEQAANPGYFWFQAQPCHNVLPESS